jgi:hypothetical protein
MVLDEGGRSVSPVCPVIVERVDGSCGDGCGIGPSALVFHLEMMVILKLDRWLLEGHGAVERIICESLRADGERLAEFCRGCLVCHRAAVLALLFTVMVGSRPFPNARSSPWFLVS